MVDSQQTHLVTNKSFRSTNESSFRQSKTKTLVILSNRFNSIYEIPKASEWRNRHTNCHCYAIVLHIIMKSNSSKTMPLLYWNYKMFIHLLSWYLKRNVVFVFAPNKLKTPIGMVNSQPTNQIYLPAIDTINVRMMANFIDIKSEQLFISRVLVCT